MKKISKHLPILVLGLFLAAALCFLAFGSNQVFKLTTPVLYLDKGEKEAIPLQTLLPGTPTYVSQDPAIATVSKDGIVKGKKTGITQIKVGLQGIKESLEVRVNYGSYLRSQLPPSPYRSDYPNLTDEQYANFRAVTTTGIKEGVLYRSSTPISSSIGRCTQADAACEKAGIRTIINLCNKKKSLKDYKGYSKTYYSKQTILAQKLDPDFFSTQFQNGLVKALRFMISHKGPYLVHCTYGRDRTGFLIAILECLMGASSEEVLHDYMITYENYNGLTPEDQMYKDLATHLMEHDLKKAFEIDDIRKADLAKEAKSYLQNLGLTKKEISSLKKQLR